MSSVTFYQARTIAPPLGNSSESQMVRALSTLEKGGLVQISSRKGGSKTWFALNCLNRFLKDHVADPPLSIWISDEGVLYPEVVHQYSQIPLSHFLLVKVKGPGEVWKTGIESAQTGLFAWIFLRTSQSSRPADLRKLQLSAEKTNSRVLLLSEAALPHWTLRAHLISDTPLSLPVGN